MLFPATIFSTYFIVSILYFIHASIAFSAIFVVTFLMSMEILYQAQLLPNILMRKMNDLHERSPWVNMFRKNMMEEKEKIKEPEPEPEPEQKEEEIKEIESSEKKEIYYVEKLALPMFEPEKEDILFVSGPEIIDAWKKEDGQWLRKDVDGVWKTGLDEVIVKEPPKIDKPKFLAEQEESLGVTFYAYNDVLEQLEKMDSETRDNLFQSFVLAEHISEYRIVIIDDKITIVSEADYTDEISVEVGEDM